jgi:hypothetical protein
MRVSISTAANTNRSLERTQRDCQKHHTYHRENITRSDIYIDRSISIDLDGINIYQYIYIYISCTGTRFLLRPIRPVVPCTDRVRSHTRLNVVEMKLLRTVRFRRTAHHHPSPCLCLSPPHQHSLVSPFPSSLDFHVPPLSQRSFVLPSYHLHNPLRLFPTSSSSSLTLPFPWFHRSAREAAQSTQSSVQISHIGVFAACIYLSISISI